MSRWPIRVRLTVVFVVAMAAVLAATGAVLHARLAAALDEQIADRMASRTASAERAISGGDISAVIADPGAVAVDAFAQLVDRDGRIVAASPGFDDQMLLTAAQAATAASAPVTVDRTVREPDGDDEPARLRATPVILGGEPRILVLGESLSDRRDTLGDLLRLLWIVGPIALVTSAVLGHLVARAALGPVEEMRRRAASIGPDSSVRELPLPAAGDEIRRLGETLNAMLRRLDAGIARERRFTADAGHELRTPLSLLRTELELALRRPRTHAELQQALASAREEVGRLGRLAEDLLTVSTADDGGLVLATSVFPAGEAVESVARRFAAPAAEAARPIEVAVDGAVVAADRERLEQALGNLVDNALRHGAGTIRLHAAREDGTVVLRVGDGGPGFPPELLGAAFERFTRADPARGGGSAGLGLAIVRAIGRAHGGEVAAANEPGGGAVVTIRLPAANPG